MMDTLTKHDNPEVRAYAHLENTVRMLRSRARDADEAAVYLAAESRFGRLLKGALAKAGEIQPEDAGREAAVVA
jgi:hypothetical protein